MQFAYRNRPTHVAEDIDPCELEEALVELATRWAKKTDSEWHSEMLQMAPGQAKFLQHVL